MCYLHTAEWLPLGASDMYRRACWGTECWDACNCGPVALQLSGRRLWHLHWSEKISIIMLYTLASLDMWVLNKRGTLKIVTWLPWKCFQNSVVIACFYSSLSLPSLCAPDFVDTCECKPSAQPLWVPVCRLALMDSQTQTDVCTETKTKKNMQTREPLKRVHSCAYVGTSSL